MPFGFHATKYQQPQTGNRKSEESLKFISSTVHPSVRRSKIRWIQQWCWFLNLNKTAWQRYRQKTPCMGSCRTAKKTVAETACFCSIAISNWRWRSVQPSSFCGRSASLNSESKTLSGTLNTGRMWKIYVFRPVASFLSQTVWDMPTAERTGVLFDTRTYGPYVRVSKTIPVRTGRTYEPLRPVRTASAYRPLRIRTKSRQLPCYTDSPSTDGRFWLGKCSREYSTITQFRRWHRVEEAGLTSTGNWNSDVCTNDRKH